MLKFRDSCECPAFLQMTSPGCRLGTQFFEEVTR